VIVGAWLSTRVQALKMHVTVSGICQNSVQGVRMRQDEVIFHGEAGAGIVVLVIIVAGLTGCAWLECAVRPFSELCFGGLPRLILKWMLTNE
jgi:hypothetical protein